MEIGINYNLGLFIHLMESVYQNRTGEGKGRKGGEKREEGAVSVCTQPSKWAIPATLP